MSCGKIKDDRAMIDQRSLNAANLKSFNVLRLSYCQHREFLIESLLRVGEMPTSFPTVSFSGADVVAKDEHAASHAQNPRSS
ncbi:MAG TPA: hypothetical protein VFF59_08005 [Anaerolineae bacterium]|nr:hypothetical protein [Anaerolineae bacterium]